MERVSRSSKLPFFTSTAPVVAFTVKISWLQHTWSDHRGPTWSPPCQDDALVAADRASTYMLCGSSW